MDAKYIDPFVNAVLYTFHTMLGVTPERQEPQMKNDNHACGDVSGIVGFAAKNIYGSVALSFPSETAIRSYRMVVGDNVTLVTDDVRDMVGELTNIVAGGAKKVFAENDLSFDISIPTVVVGKNHTLSHRGGTPLALVQFGLEGGSFVMEISLKVDETREGFSKNRETATLPLEA